MFRDDFEFHDDAGASHHGGAHKPREAAAEAAPAAAAAAGSMPDAGALLDQAVPVVQPSGDIVWLSDAEAELKKIPFFVRGKARRNTENYAQSKGVTAISVETLYEAKAHYAR
jgi:light-independent protochlorophyllide reductase subunit B